MGFAPASDPEYVALIAVNDPQTTYWGELTTALSSACTISPPMALATLERDVDLISSLSWSAGDPEER